MPNLQKTLVHAIIAVLLLSAVPVTGAKTLPVSADAAPEGSPLEELESLRGGTDSDAVPSTASLSGDFEPNLGQSHEDVAFTARAPGYTFFLTHQEAVFVLTGEPLEQDETDDAGLSADEPPALGPSQVVRMRFEGAETPAITGQGERLGKSNYFIGNDPDEWATNVPHYDEVLVEGLWPGIDMVFLSTEEGAVRFDFHVQAGAHPQDILLSFEGADASMGDNGALVLSYRDGPLMQFPAPYTYQEIQGRQKEVPSGFIVGDDGTVGFQVQAIDATLPLVIDPVALAYSTYLGGSEQEIHGGIAVDEFGKAYVTGDTQSPDFPVEDPFQSTNSGQRTAYVTKFNHDGTDILFSTYIGGTDTDNPKDITLDQDGRIHIVGRTRSTDYPTTPDAVQASHPGGPGSFVAFYTVLEATGNSLAFSTYLGGTSNDEAYGISVDSEGKAHIVGWTASSDLATVNAIQPTYPGGSRSGFIFEINTMDWTVGYATYLGGTAADRALSVAARPGSVYITGQTSSTDFPTTGGAFQETYPGGPNSAFITLLNTTGVLVASTFLGGSGDDRGVAIRLATDGAPYIAGTTSSTDFPTTTGTLQESYPGGDVSTFVTRVDPLIGAIGLGTYVGGTGTDNLQGLALDGSRVHISGHTTSTDLPILDGIITSQPGLNTVFVTTLDAAGALVMSTYLGGEKADHGAALAVDQQGNVYVHGITRSDDFPITSGAYQEEPPGEFIDGFGRIQSGFVAKLAFPGIWSWGRVDSGRLGNGETHERFTPLRVLGPDGEGLLEDIIEVSGGDESTLALKNDGSVWTWGQTGFFGNSGTGRSTPVQVEGPGGDGHLLNITDVSAGAHPNAFDHNLVVRGDGTVWSWGYDAWGQLGDGDAGGWGTTPRQVVGLAGDGFLENIQEVSAGAGHSLALASDGTVWAWGNNLEGQLGDNTTDSTSTPVHVLGPGGTGVLDNIVQVAAGDGYSLALSASGEVWGWGNNDFGKLGDGTTDSRLTPVQVMGPGGDGFLGNVDAISAGSSHSLALQTNVTVWAWGAGFAGQLGDGESSSSSTPVSVPGPYVGISAGSSRSFAVANDGSAWAWGSNANGRLGDNTTTNRASPVQIVGADGVGFLTGATQASAGLAHSLVLDQDGHVWAWGLKTHGASGDGTTHMHRTPVDVLGPDGDGFLTEVRQVSAHAAHTLALRDDGSVWAWGDRALGQGNPDYLTIPHRVKGPGGDGFLEDMVQVATGTFSSLALRADGTVWSWGATGGTPSQVVGEDGIGFLEGMVAIGRGSGASYSIGSDGTVWAWGSNSDGQLGDGTFDFRLTPARVLGPDGTGFLGNVKQISSYGSTVLALRDDGTVWAWGDNDFGQVGDGTTNPRSLPAQVLGPGGDGFLTGVTQISNGGQHSLALKEDGTLWAWGRGTGGVLGDNSIDDRHTPIQVHGPNGDGFMEDAVAISAGNDHSMAVRSDGTAWAWGTNRDGLLGEAPHTNQRRVPTQVAGPDGDGHLRGVRQIEAGGRHSLALTNLLPPTPPLGLAAVAGLDLGEITLDWSPPRETGGEPIVAYQIYAGNVTGGPYTLIGSTGPGIRTLLEGGLPDGFERCYVVTALNDIGESLHSNEACATTFDVPGTPTAFDATTGETPGTIDIVWEAPLNDGGLAVTGYNLYAGDDTQTSFSLLAELGPNVTAFAETGLGHSAPRFYQVSALNEAGEGERTQSFGSTTLQPDDPPPLPEGTSATSAVWQGHYVYVFGGRSEDGNDTDSIIRFHPDDNEITTLNLTLPSPRLGTSATWIPGVFPNSTSGPSVNACDPNCPAGRSMIFGGLPLPGTPGQQHVEPEDCHGSCPAARQIVFFEPEADTVGLSNATFDEGRFGTSALFVPDDGTQTHDETGTQDCHGSCPAGRSFIFGGFPIDPPGQQSIEPLDCHGSCPVGRQIMEYDPVDDTLTPHDDTLPVPLGGTSAVWDPVSQVAYIFGGRHTDEVQSADCHGSCPGWIIEFDPHAQVTTSSVTVLPAELPSPRWNTSAFFDGQFAYIMGGENETGFIDEIVRFDPVTQSVDIVGTLPTKRTQTSTAFDGQHAYVIGGLEEGNFSTDEIVKYTPTAPQQAQAHAGPGAGQITLSWEAPSNDGGSPVTAYRLYRSLSEDLWDRVAVVDVNDTEYVDSGLASGTVVSYRVSAVNLIGEGPQGETVQVATFDRPGTPTDLTGGPSGLGEIELSWNPPDDGGSPILAYHVYRSNDTTGPFEPIGVTSGAVTTFTDSGLDPLDTRHYRVSAENLVGEGNQSDAVTLASFDPLNIYVTENGPITIQEAAEFLEPGGTIWLGPGVYQENVTLPVNATIQNGTADNTTALMATPGPAVIEGGILVTGADSVAVRGIEINAIKSGARSGVAFRSVGVETVDLSDLIVRGEGAPTGEGFFRGIVDVRGVQELVFVDNRVEGDPDAGGFSSGLRVEPAKSGAPEIDIQRNAITSVRGAGITLTGENGATRALIKDNSLVGGMRGLLLYETRHDTLRIEDNAFGLSDMGVQVLGDHTGESNFRYNQIVENDLGFATAPDTLGLDLRHNWWGQATGPLVGQQVNLEPGDYTPWCLDEGCSADRGATDPLLP